MIIDNLKLTDVTCQTETHSSLSLISNRETVRIIKATSYSIRTPILPKLKISCVCLARDKPVWRLDYDVAHSGGFDTTLRDNLGYYVWWRRHGTEKLCQVSPG